MLLLEEIHMDDYDRLIQLCDAMAGAQGVMGYGAHRTKKATISMLFPIP